MFLRDVILAANDLPREKVECPEWGCDVYIRTLTGAERDQFESATVSKKGKQREPNLENIRARLVCLAAVDADGRSVFTLADVDALGGKSSRVLDRLFDVASRLSGFTERDVKELEKN